MQSYPIDQCCFATGHREMPLHRRRAILARTREVLEHLIRRGITHFYAGGAVGYDTWFACAVLSLKQKYPHITLTVLLPDREYPSDKSAEDALCMARVLEEADEVEQVPSYGQEPALKRNDMLISRGKTCVAYLRDNAITPRGGTAYTVNHALTCGREILLIALPDDYDTERTPI